MLVKTTFLNDTINSFIETGLIAIVILTGSSTLLYLYLAYLIFSIICSVITTAFLKLNRNVEKAFSKMLIPAKPWWGFAIYNLSNIALLAYTGYIGSSVLYLISCIFIWINLYTLKP